MSNKAYFYQIDKNREQLEAFMDWVDYSNPAWSYFNYAFYSEKSPKGFYKKKTPNFRGLFLCHPIWINNLRFEPIACSRPSLFEG